MKKTKNTSRILSYVFKLALPLGIVAPLVVSCRSTKPDEPSNPEVGLVVKQNLKPGDFGWANKRADEVVNLITKDWVFESKEKIFTNPDLLKNKDKIFNLKASIVGDKSQIEVKFDYENDTNLALQTISFKISGFSISQLQDYKIIAKNNLSSSTFGWSDKSAYEVISQINSSWLVQNKTKLFDFSDELTSTALISSVSATKVDQSKKIVIVMVLKKTSTHNEKTIEVEISGFKLPEKLILKSNIKAEDFGWQDRTANEVAVEMGFKTNVFIFNNKDKIFEESFFLTDILQVMQYGKPNPSNDGTSFTISARIKYSETVEWFHITITGFKQSV